MYIPLFSLKIQISFRVNGKSIQEWKIQAHWKNSAQETREDHKQNTTTQHRKRKR
jgi:hypothetical protein